MDSTKEPSRFKQWLVNTWEKFLALVVSRKFLAAVSVTFAAIANDSPAPGLDPVTIDILWKTWSVFIAAVAIEDGLRAR